jgi:hypothetical protein
MVREGSVTLRHFVLRHVARNTVADAHFARWSRCSLLLRLSLGDVACEAIGIVGPGFADQGLMRVVASDTSNARVSVFSPTATFFEPVRLKADASNPNIGGHLHRDVRPGSVAGTAKVYGVGGREFLWVHDGAS